MRNSPEDRDRWNDQRKKIVATMWNEGQSSTEIANTFGVSRSSILGLVHRMGLSNRRAVTPRVASNPKAPTKFNFASNKAKAAPKPPAEPYVARETIVTPPDQRLSFDDLIDGRCKYAHGESHPYTFCGAKSAVPGGSWCETHHHKVFGTKPMVPTNEGTGGFTQQVSENIGELEGAV